MKEKINEFGPARMARELGIKESTLKRKISTMDFTLGQIKKIKIILEIDNEQLCSLLKI